MQKSIMIVGSSNFDINLKVKDIPVPGETVLSDFLEIGFGGKGGNQSFTVKKIGGEVDYLTCIGDDVFGQLYLETFRKNGFDLDFIKVIKSRQNGIAVVNIDKDGRNTIVVYPGTSTALTPQIVMDNLDIILDHDMIMTQLEIPVETVELLAQKITENNIFILNPSPVNKDYDYSRILKKVDILIPNEIELAQLSGVKVDAQEQVKEAASKIMDSGVKNLIVTLGKNGAMVINKDISEYIGPTEHKAIDSAGAGDAFAGAFMYKFALTEDLVKSAVFANKVAGISVTRNGTHKSVPTRAEIESMGDYFKD